eukprot:jgi/Chrzof1/3096/Cz12g11170.t1
MSRFMWLQQAHLEEQINQCNVLKARLTSAEARQRAQDKVVRETREALLTRQATAAAVVALAAKSAAEKDRLLQAQLTRTEDHEAVRQALLRVGSLNEDNERLQQQLCRAQQRPVLNFHISIADREEEIAMLRRQLAEEHSQNAALQHKLGEERSHSAALQDTLQQERSHSAARQDTLQQERSHSAALEDALQEQRSQAAALEDALQEQRSHNAASEHSLQQMNIFQKDLAEARQALAQAQAVASVGLIHRKRLSSTGSDSSSPTLSRSDSGSGSESTLHTFHPTPPAPPSYPPPPPPPPRFLQTDENVDRPPGFTQKISSASVKLPPGFDYPPPPPPPPHMPHTSSQPPHHHTAADMVWDGPPGFSTKMSSTAVAKTQTHHQAAHHNSHHHQRLDFPASSSRSTGCRHAGKFH